MVVSLALGLEKRFNSKGAHKNGLRKHRKTFENPTLFSLSVVGDAALAKRIGAPETRMTWYSVMRHAHYRSVHH